MSTIKQKTVRVELSDGSTVEVRRMRWKDARAFLRAMSSMGAKLLGFKKEDLAAVVPVLLGESEQVASALATACTDLKAEDFEALDMIDAMKVLQAGFELNYDDELKNFLAGIGAKLATLMPRGEAKTS